MGKSEISSKVAGLIVSMIAVSGQETRKNKDGSRLTIGVFTSGIEDQYQSTILRGAIASAQDYDVNLIVYIGGELDSPVKDRVNGNVVYDLAVDSMIDALVLFSGTLVGFVGLERQIEFRAQYPVPAVSIAATLPNAHSVLLNNEYGVQEAVRHLIDVHGYRRIAFIQGPEGNKEAALRFQAYVDTLKAYAIPYDPQLVVAGQYQTEDGEEAVRTLLDERKVSVDAIVAANDNAAIGALNALLKRNIAVPGQIAVVGFDDIDDAHATIPSLTTVRQPLYEQGKYGVELVLALLRGENAVDPLVLDPELVVRRSCGCFTSPNLDVAVEDVISEHGSIEKRLADAKTVIIAGMLSVVPSMGNFHQTEKLFDAFLEDLFDNSETLPANRFVSVLHTITYELLLEHAEIHGWHEVLTIMRDMMSPILGADVELRIRAENLWQQGRILLSEEIQHAEANKQLQVKTQAGALNAIGEPLLTVTNVSDLAAVMSEGLPMLGVRVCHIARYTDASREWLQPIFRYDQGNPQISATIMDNETRYPSQALIPPTLLPANRRYTLIVEALHFGDTLFGIIVLEIEQAQAYIYEALRRQISSALHKASIVQELQEKHAQLETALVELKTTQSLLIHSEKMNALGQMVAGVAHEINNPIAFVNSNVHSLSKTFEEIIAAYDRLEDFARRAMGTGGGTDLERMREESDLDYLVDDTKDLIEQTANGLKRVKDIVTELRKFSRLDEAEFKLSNLRENIESTLLVASGELRNRVTVELDVDPKLALTCAPAELNQVFLNIITNAAQAIEGNGKIAISAHEHGDDVVIEFRDNGSGIPEDVIGHIFDPFYTTKPVGVGTGLGLAISHKIIVDSHKGTIDVESKPGVGTKFRIQIPKENHA